MIRCLIQLSKMTVKMSRSKILILFCVSFYFLEIGIADVLKNDEEQQLLDERIRSLVIVIISQSNSYHHVKAMKLREEIYEHADKISQARPVVHISHLDFPHVGAWTFLPLISPLLEVHQTKATGVLFLQDHTVLDLRRFADVVAKYQHQVRFVGYALHDNEASIIHHFAFYEDPTRFKYPNLASGFYMTTELLLKLNDRLNQESIKTDFNIDPAHELALFIWNEGNGTELTHDDTFCTTPPTGPAIECATYPQAFKPCSPAVDLEEVYFAVKTCKKFHADRLRVVRSTWAPHVQHIRYFSDHADRTIPTVNIGIPNTDVGHCEKTFAILRYALNDINTIETQNGGDKIKWLVLVDDDTILSVSHVMNLLTCYNPEESIVLGERYGYGVRTHKGYNYITGGGGTIISRRLLPSLATHCLCPSARTPDDMYLGFCLRELGTEIVHSPLFHQARPNDYSKGYLKSHETNTVSFHKHWMVDPIKIYKTWFEKADLLLESRVEHQEL
ncbi:beta-1,3-glucosyltransferase isoform X2 [Atheta coriaria]|uniref:beta-1,3-glucosyltransferase isoform X2 n=1 Tax=Dalotia coriaria TaxID=877792 RepID=UPI0031F3E98F